MKCVLFVLIALALATNLWAASGSDDFNRSNVDPLDGSWTLMTADYGYYPRIVSNHVEVNLALDIGQAYFAGFTATDDQEMRVNITIGGGADLTAAKLLARASGRNLEGTPDAIYYECTAFAQNTYDNVSSWILKDITGSYTVLASENATSWGAGDELKCRAVGTALTLFRNGSVLLTTTDGAISSGQPGIGVGGFTGTPADAQLDNFYATDYVASATLVRHRAVIQ